MNRKELLSHLVCAKWWRWSLQHETVMKRSYTEEPCLLAAAEMGVWELKKDEWHLLYRGEEYPRTSVSFTWSWQDAFHCSPADMMIPMKINRAGYSLVLHGSSPCRLSCHSCATSVSAVWSASSLASVLVQASRSLTLTLFSMIRIELFNI